METPYLSAVEAIKFHIGEIEHSVKTTDINPTTSLNSYIRNVLHLTGTKNMCFEGGCGACIVAVEEIVNDKKITFAVNSCLVSVLSCHGWKILTNEGIGNPLIGYHNLQKLLAANNGSQCGFCSSGMVMNMYALQQTGTVSKKQIENSFGGNLCRCTGYRPILEAFKKLASDTDYAPDIEELHLCDGGTCRRNCPGCPNHSTSFYLEFGGSKWVKIYLLKDLLMILKNNATSKYMLVAGNTAKGVYRLPLSAPLLDLYLDISRVVELITYTVDENTLALGANITLTQAMNIFENLSKRVGFAYLSQMKDHLDLVAHVPVRNIGTLAGNLMIKNNHHEFPSDIFIMLVTFNATILIVDTNGNEMRVLAEDFPKVDMNQKVIKSIILNTIDDSHKYNTYKIMYRSQNSHAMVNAGFLFQFSNNLVKKCRIAYGGINPNFVRAVKTEALLNGLNLYDNVTLQRVYKSLNNELIPNYNPPEPSPEYRKNLAVSLFYKFVLKTAPTNLVSLKNASGGTMIERPLSNGRQEFGTNKDKWPLSEPVTKIGALDQTSGQAEYIQDLPDQPNQLHGAFVLAEAPAGSIIQATDATKALNMEGVVAYYDHTSIPGENNIMPNQLGYTMIEELFCSGTIKYVDQPIGFIVAKDRNTALTAASKVRVWYSYPGEKPLLTIQDVLNANATDRITEAYTFVASRRGKDVKHVIKGSWNVKQQYHFHMEVQCCQVIPKEDSIDIYAATQWMDITQISIANVLKIPNNRVNLFVRRLGGGFGGKISKASFLASSAALAAFKLRKPVRVSLPFEVNMRMMGKRLPLYSTYEIGVNDTGVIQYMDAHLYSEYGSGGNEDIDFLVYPAFENCYDISTWNYSTNRVRTDMPAHTYARAPGSLEGIGLIESIMEEIAFTVGMDAIDVRLNNLNPLTSEKLPEFWKTMQSFGDVADRRAAIEAFNNANRWRKKGMSIVSMSWLLYVLGNFNVLVSIFHADGTVAVSHGGIEIGQGINTKVAQVTAYKFGISLEKVIVKPNYNFIVPNNFATANSLTTEANVFGVIHACDQLIERMKPIKDKLNNPSWETLVKECFAQNVLLSATGQFTQDNLKEYRVYGLCATEVEVDILTGQREITQVDIIEDVGDSMSPLLDIGQCEGAFVMGLGHYIFEDLIFNPEGKLLTDRTWNYKIPGMKDIPLNFRIKFPERNPNPLGILKSKAVSEPPTCLSVSVPLAIRNALKSARSYANSQAKKWVPFDGPTTVEFTQMNSLNSFDQYLL